MHVIHTLLKRLSSGGIFCHQFQLSQVPKDHEWDINVDEQLVIQWMCGATAPDTALQLMFPMCKR